MAKISINVKSGELEKKDIVVGIDLGTTNSLVAYVNKETLRPEILGNIDDLLVPSIIHFNNNHEPIVGQKAKEALAKHPETTIFSVKRLLGKTYRDVADHAEFYTYKIIDDTEDALVKVECGGIFHTPVSLSSIILSELKKRAEEKLHASVNKAVVTVPAYFNDNQRQAVRDAGKLAGLDILRIVNEPTAASLAYGLGLGKTDEKTILVYDLGGGTFDVSILHIQQGIFEVLSTNGDTYLGGDDVDRMIVQHWAKTHNLHLKTLPRQDYLTLRLMAEQAKVLVSKNTSNIFKQSFVHNNINLSLNLSYPELENLSTAFLQKTLNCVDAALQDAQLTNVLPDEIVLVGGSTRLPFIKAALSKKFPGVMINQNLNPDEVVALGAAVEADILAGNRSDILLLDVTPLSLGIETLGGLMDVIIPRNAKIPTAAARQYTTSIDGQTNLSVNVFQGEREMVAQNRKLASFTLKNIPAMPAGLPKIEIRFLLDADGILKVSATELRSNTKQEITVKPQYGLDDATVEKMLQEGFTNAQKDMQQRLLEEHKNEGKQLIYFAEKFLEKNKSILSAKEIAETQNLMANLSVEINNLDDQAILMAIEKLNEYTRPFAEIAMDKAIQDSLSGTKII